MAREWAKDPTVKVVHLNRSLRTVTGVKTATNIRPDAAAEEHPGPDGSKGIRMTEVLSPSQEPDELMKKMEAERHRLPEGFHLGEIQVVKPSAEAPVDTPETLPDLDIPDVLIP